MPKKFKINLSEEERDLIDSGAKTSFARYRQMCKVGDYFIVGLNKYEVYDIQYLTLYDVATFYRGSEGFTNSVDYIKYWNRNNKKEYSTFDSVYFHKFRKLEDEELVVA